MPRSRTRARLRAVRLAAQPPVRDPKDPMDDDSKRTPERMNALRRTIRQKLRRAAAARAEAAARRNVSSRADEEG
jgi:hypothetical protein